MSQTTPPPHYQAVDGVNPNSVPYKTTATGARMPVVGLGTFGSDHYSIESIAGAVKSAIEVGCHIDCTAV
jgi:diketogulonate reductase-like aldo/keto reductase